MTKKLEDILNLPNVKEAFKQVDAKNLVYHYTFLEMGVHLDEVQRLRQEADDKKNNNNNTANGLNASISALS